MMADGVGRRWCSPGRFGGCYYVESMQFLEYLLAAAYENEVGVHGHRIAGNERPLTRRTNEGLGGREAGQYRTVSTVPKWRNDAGSERRAGEQK